MTFEDLDDAQRVELKQHILTERNDSRGEGTSWEELANADGLVSDEDARDWSEGTTFNAEDFSPEDPGEEWSRKALSRAEEIGVVEYDVNGRYMEYWSFFGSEGWYFVRHDLAKDEEVFRGANIPWDGETIPAFLKSPRGGLKYNYMEG